LPSLLASAWANPCRRPVPLFIQAPKPQTVDYREEGDLERFLTTICTAQQKLLTRRCKPFNHKSIAAMLKR
jgi:hypothetical protein